MKIKNVSGEDRIVPWLDGRLVAAGQVVDVDGEYVYNFTSSASWEPADAEAQAVHNGAEAEREVIDSVPYVDGRPEQPARNASRDEWVAYVVAAGDAVNPDALDGMGRDEIRDTYTTEV